MARRKKDDNVVAMLMEAPWWLSFILAMCVLVGGYVMFGGKPADAFDASRAKMFMMAVKALTLFLLLVSAVAFVRSLAASMREEPSQKNERPLPTLTPSNAPSRLNHSASRMTLGVLRDLEWKRFEEVCKHLHELRGLRAVETPLGADGGVDLRLYKQGEQEVFAICQCKAWRNRQVGVAVVREFLGVRTHENAKHAFILASGDFSLDAREFAAANGIHLIDGPKIIAEIAKLSPEEQTDLFERATAGDYTTPTCPSCGVKMTYRQGTRNQSGFWGCVNYPRCRQKIHGFKS